MSFLVSSPSPAPVPAAAPLGLSPEEIAAKEASEGSEKARQKKKKGFSSTLLTGAGGLQSAAPTDKKTLLGS